jgi:hypothetical protein
MRRCAAAKTDGDGDRRYQRQRAEYGEHPTPAEKIADQPSQRCSEQGSGHGPGQGTPDRNLPFFRRDQIAGEPESDRKYPAGADPCKNARSEQQRKRRR